MDDVQLVDMLESYPHFMTPELQTIISAKEEFAQLASIPGGDKKAKRGTYFNHQKLTHRYLRAYDDILVISETGTGKSCEILGFAEWANDEYMKSKTEPNNVDDKMAHFKKCIIMAKGPTQKAEIKHQLACVCSREGKYDTALVRKAKKESTQKSNMTNEIKKYFTITTYKTFANKIIKDYPNEEDEEKMAKDFSDVIFWADEAHNLLVDPAVGTQVREKHETYQHIHKIFHLAKRSKRILSTATPMINGEEEIGSLMNLILPLDGKLPDGYDYKNAPDRDIRAFFPEAPFDPRTVTVDDLKYIFRNELPKDFDFVSNMDYLIGLYFRGQFHQNFRFSTANENDYEPYFRGRISYVRSSNPKVDVSYEGIRYDNEITIGNVSYQSQAVIYGSDMSEFQTEAYLRAMNRENTGKTDIYADERQASNFVFPDGFWGKGATEQEKNIEKEKRRLKKLAKEVAEKTKTGMLESEMFEDEGERFLPTTGRNIGTGESRAYRRFVVAKGDNYYPTDEFRPWLENLENMRILSCKYAEIVRLVMNNPGNAFVYGEYVSGSGTIVLGLCFQGMGFERYNENTSIFSSTKGETVKSYCSPERASVNDAMRTVKNNIYPYGARRPDGKIQPYRYALLTKDTSKSNAKFDSMMETMNSYENRNGDYIKVLISSRVGRDGINVNNVLQIHLIGSEWNQSSMYQALSRGIRATSHSDLIKDKREEILRETALLDEQISILENEREDNPDAELMLSELIERKNILGDPDDVNIKVKIYKHAALSLSDRQNAISKYFIDAMKNFEQNPNDAGLKNIYEYYESLYKNPERIKGNTKEEQNFLQLDNSKFSIDLRMYWKSEEKDRKIKRVLRIMKKCAIGCQIHRQRNIVKAEDYTPICDYDTCEYQCVDPIPDYRDYSTYDVLYYGNIINDAVDTVATIFCQRNALTLREIFSYASTFREKYILMALEKIITEKIPLTDRFGYRTYLREDDGTFYLDRNYPVGIPPSYSMSLYTNGLIAVQKQNLADIFVNIESSEYMETLEELQMITDKDEFNNRLDALSIEGQAIILEESLKHYIMGDRSNVITGIYNKFSGSIFMIREPITELKLEREKLLSNSPKRGRRANPNTVKLTKKINPISLEPSNLARDTDSEYVWLHTLYTQIGPETGYATTARFNKAEGRIRLLKPSELSNGWRDLTDIDNERLVYNKFIQVEIAERAKPFEKEGIYGFILPADKKFRIRNKFAENVSASEDARKLKRGRVCITSSRKDLIDIMWVIEVPEPEGYFTEYENDEDDRREIIAFLLDRGVNKQEEELETWSFERLVYYYKWYYASSIKRGIMCNSIKEVLESKGLLMQ